MPAPAGPPARAPISETTKDPPLPPTTTGWAAWAAQSEPTQPNSPAAQSPAQTAPLPQKVDNVKRREDSLASPELQPRYSFAGKYEPYKEAADRSRISLGDFGMTLLQGQTGQPRSDYHGMRKETFMKLRYTGDRECNACISPLHALEGMSLLLTCADRKTAQQLGDMVKDVLSSHIEISANPADMHNLHGLIVDMGKDAREFFHSATRVYIDHVPGMTARKEVLEQAELYNYNKGKTGAIRTVAFATDPVGTATVAKINHDIASSTNNALRYCVRNDNAPNHNAQCVVVSAAEWTFHWNKKPTDVKKFFYDTKKGAGNALCKSVVDAWETGPDAYRYHKTGEYELIELDSHYKDMKLYLYKSSRSSDLSYREFLGAIDSLPLEKKKLASLCFPRFAHTLPAALSSTLNAKGDYAVPRLFDHEKSELTALYSGGSMYSPSLVTLWEHYHKVKFSMTCDLPTRDFHRGKTVDPVQLHFDGPVYHVRPGVRRRAHGGGDAEPRQYGGGGESQQDPFVREKELATQRMEVTPEARDEKEPVKKPAKEPVKEPAKNTKPVKENKEKNEPAKKTEPSLDEKEKKTEPAKPVAPVKKEPMKEAKREVLTNPLNTLLQNALVKTQSESKKKEPVKEPKELVKGPKEPVKGLKEPVKTEKRKSDKDRKSPDTKSDESKEGRKKRTPRTEDTRRDLQSVDDLVIDARMKTSEPQLARKATELNFSPTQLNSPATGRKHATTQPPTAMEPQQPPAIRSRRNRPANSPDQLLLVSKVASPTQLHHAYPEKPRLLYREEDVSDPPEGFDLNAAFQPTEGVTDMSAEVSFDTPFLYMLTRKLPTGQTIPACIGRFTNIEFQHIYRLDDPSREASKKGNPV